MRSQYILLFLLILLISFLFILNNFEKNYFYTFNIADYIARDFEAKLRIYGSNSLTIINETYFRLCQEYRMLCLYNGSHIIVNNSKLIIISVQVNQTAGAPGSRPPREILPLIR